MSGDPDRDRSRGQPRRGQATEVVIYGAFRLQPIIRAPINFQECSKHIAVWNLVGASKKSVFQSLVVFQVFVNSLQMPKFFVNSNVDQLRMIGAPINFQKCGETIAVLEPGRRVVNYHMKTLASNS